ncbi:Lcl domain-containing protein [Leptospira sp. GIMC2001]|uniref:Lcl domain-containing protein n=1 Tax=Leptospira sp. GIMC2001 TaxID=1513297 RepID=UPI00234BCFB0|nr:DUF1566 domain-containing protein [Leptospira sp. GIMC2001]WCL50131.1 DUF1566 domain-containing protein [Leptospira sp. GIMC2001]
MRITFILHRFFKLFIRLLIFSFGLISFYGCEIFPTLNKLHIDNLAEINIAICIADPSSSFCETGIPNSTTETDEGTDSEEGEVPQEPITNPEPPSVIEPDLTPPTLISTYPLNGSSQVPPCDGNPCRGRIILTFSESMDTNKNHSMDIFVSDAGTFLPVSNNPEFVWTTTSFANDTLNVFVSWYWFPENSRLQFKLDIENLMDSSGNKLLTPIELTFATTVSNQSFQISDTDVSTCYNESGSVPVCAVVSASYPLQDGSLIGTPQNRSFEGPILAGVGEHITRDNVSGLVWATCNIGQSGVGCSGIEEKLNWYQALNACHSYNMANFESGYANRKNWRLPTKQEVASLPPLNYFNPALDPSLFPNSTSSNIWTLTGRGTDSFGLNFAWNLNGNTGIIQNSMKTSTSFIVRCVSSQALNLARSFTDNGDGTITDNNAKLRWRKCVNGLSGSSCATGSVMPSNWGNALLECEALGSGWRLPNYHELLSLVDNRFNAPSIDPIYFPNTSPSSHWTSTTSADNSKNAWIVLFSNGASNPVTKTSFAPLIRCVRNEP